MGEKNVFEVLSKVQQKVNAPKDQFNSFGKYKFRNLESINAAAKPVCAENNAGYFLSDEVVKIDERFYVKATATFFADGCSGVATATAYAREENEKKGMDAAQITGLASSYARKYALCGLLAIDDNDDVDAMDNRSQSKKTAPKKMQKPTETKNPHEIMAGLVADFAHAKGKTPQDVCHALNKTKTLQNMGVTEQTKEYTQEQELAAIAILNQWLGM